MIEQSNLDGPVYGTLIKTDTKERLVTDRLKPKDIQFGISHEIEIIQNEQTDNILVIYNDEPQPNAYLYSSGDHGHFKQQFNAQRNPADRVETYYYGMAKRDGQLEPYFMRNPVAVKLTDVDVDRNDFTLPPTLLGYGYNQRFAYLPQLNQLIGDMPATFTDRYKRPISAKAMFYHKYFPMSIDKVTDHFKDLSSTLQNFPLVVKLNPEPEHATVACLDLEPNATPEQAQVIDQYEAYYVEETPRGGKHYLIKINPDNQEFKYRLNENLEVQVHCQITLYGINGKWLNDNPKESHFDKDLATGHQKIMTTDIEEPAELTNIIDDVININQQLGRYNPEQIQREYMLDDDDSHADWNALYHVYLNNIQPFATQIDNKNLPWVLSFYVERMIPDRSKHMDNRQGLPYLVWLAAKVITRIKEQRGEVYE